MQKPKNYNEAKVQGDFVPVELGGHYLVIKQVAEKKSKTGKDMLVVLFDFSDKDKQSGYFMEAFKDDIRPDKKWPNQATQYILCEDQDGNCSRALKTFCTCVEHSNTGFSCWKSDETFDFRGIKGKAVGGVFGVQKDFYDGRELEKRVLRWFVSSDKVEGASVPNEVETQAYKNRAAGYPAGAMPTGDGFMSIPDSLDEELPFN